MFVFFLLTSLYASGQNGFCGTVDDGSMRERLLRNRALLDKIEIREDEWIFVPIQFHVVTKSDGTGGIDEIKIIRELCNINTRYAPYKIKYYLNGDFNYIKSTKLYDNPGENISVSKIRSNRNKYPNAISMFIVGNIPAGGSTGEVLGYYSPPLDVLVVRKSQFAINGQTTVHELGHFFSLKHPFYGWECDPYDPAKHGNPVNILVTECGFEIEFADGSNCADAADMICDTPPDYMTGITDENRDCKMDYVILDYHGDTVKTMENNYMSYYFDCENYEFTPMQIEQYKADFYSSDRDKLRQGQVEPDTSALDLSSFEVTSPKNGSKLEYYDKVHLEWTPIDNAFGYIVIVEQKGFQVFTASVTGANSVVIEGLKPKKWYKVRIIPYSKADGCVPQSEEYKFKTGEWTVSNKEIVGADDITVYPNPVQGNLLHMDSDNNYGKVQLKIINVLGKVVDSRSIKVNKGVNTIDVSNILVGHYSLIIETQDKKFFRKSFVKQ